MLCINLDGGYGYPINFLEEFFGLLLRKYGPEKVLSKLTFISNDEPSLINEINGYMLPKKILNINIKYKRKTLNINNYGVMIGKIGDKWRKKELLKILNVGKLFIDYNIKPDYEKRIYIKDKYRLHYNYYADPLSVCLKYSQERKCWEIVFGECGTSYIHFNTKNDINLIIEKVKKYKIKRKKIIKNLCCLYISKIWKWLFKK